MPKDKVHAKAMKVRRRILGSTYVDGAVAEIRPHTREFQDLIVRYGWGVWTRPGLDYRTRRILVLGTMVALGRWEEFDMHARAALEDNFSLNDIKELLLQQTIYCGAPAANTAFHHLNAVIDELVAKGVKIKDLRK